MESTHRKVGSRNKYFVGGSRDTDHVSGQITDTIGTVVLFLAILVMGVIFMAVSGCSHNVDNIIKPIELVNVTVQGDGQDREQMLNEPFQYKGKITIVTYDISHDMQMALNRAKMRAKVIMGNRGFNSIQTIEQQIMRHGNGVQYVALVTSQQF